MRKQNKECKLILGLFVIMFFVLIGFDLVFAASQFSGTTGFSGSGSYSGTGSYGTTGFSGSYDTSYSGVRVYGASSNPQFNNPGFLSATEFTPVGVYWPKFDSQDCMARQDFIMQIAPGGCSPAVVRSDLLEEQNVPVFCKVMAIQVNPFIDVTRIKSLTFNGNYPKGVSGLSYFPARAAVQSQTSLVSSPVKDNLGYLVVVLSQNQLEKTMPDFINGTVTATVNYDIQKAFGIGNTNFYASEMSDDDWLRDYKQYGFWNGKGFIRADSIDATGTTISVYRDADSKEATLRINKGETSRDIYLGGFYCAAGMNIQLQNIDAPVDSALLQINDQQLWVAKGDNVLDGKCLVTDLQLSGGGGRVRLSCSVQNGVIDLSLNPGKVTFAINGNEVTNVVGSRVNIPGVNGNIFLGYVGQYADGTNFAVLLKDPYSYEEYSFADKDIYSALQNIVKSKGSIDQVNKDIKAAIINQYRRKVSSYGGRFDPNTLQIEIATTQNSAFGIITLKDISIAKNKNWDLASEQDKLAKEYYDQSIKKYSDLASFYPSEKMLLDSNEDPYAAVGLYNSAVLSKEMGMNEEAQKYYTKLIETYPDSNVARQAMNDQQLLMKYDAYQSKAILNIDNDQYSINLLDFKKPDINDASATLLINGKPEILALNDVKFLDSRNGSVANIQLVEIKDDYVTVNYNGNSANVYSGFNYNNPGYSNSYLNGYGNTQKINLHQQAVFNNIVVNLADIKLNKQVKLNIIPKAFGPLGQTNFTFNIGIEKRAIQLSPEQTKSLMDSINNQIKTWSDVNYKLGEVVKGLKAACFATSAVLAVKNLVSGFSGEAMARKELMTGQNGWNDYCKKLVSDGTSSKYTSQTYSSIESCLLGHGTYIQKDVDAYSNQIQQTNNVIKNLQGPVQKTDVLDLQGQVDQKNVENQFKQQFSSYCSGLSGSVKLPDKDGTTIPVNTMCNWNSMTYEQQKDIMTLVNTRNSGSDVMNGVIDSQLGKEVLAAKNFAENEGARISAENEANKLNLGLGTLTPVGDNAIYGPVKTLTKSDLSNPAYSNFKEGDSVVRVFIPVSQNFGGKDSFSADSSVAGKEVIVKVKSDASNKNVYIPDYGAKIDTVDGNLVQGQGLSDVQRYMGEAKMNKIIPVTPKAYQNRMLNPENLKVEYFENAPYKGLPSFVPFDVTNGWYVQLEYVLSGFGKPYDESGRAVNYYICNVGQNGIPEYKQSADDICRYYNGASNDLGFEGMSASDSAKLVQAAQSAISQAAKQYGQKQITINGRRFASGVSFGGEAGRCSDFMSPEDCQIMFNVCDPVICPASRCDLGGKFRVNDVIQTGIIGGLSLCLPNIKEGILIPICLSGVNAGIQNYLSVLNSTSQCLNESLATGKNVGICNEIESIYLCEFFWKEASPLVNVIIPRLFEMLYSQGVRGGGEYLTVQKAWDNTQTAINYFTNQYAVNSMTAFRARSTDELGTDICSSFMSVTTGNLSSFFDKLIEPDSPVQYSAWFSEESFTTATIPATSQYKVYYHIYSGQDIGSYYSVYLKDLPQSNYVYVSGTYVIDSGYIPRGSQVDQTKTFTAVSGYKQLCVSVNGQDNCDFGKVSTSFALNSISDMYAASQVTTNISGQSQCVAGTASLYSLVQPNLEAGVSGVVDPALYNQGIVRVCATQNPGKQVLPNGQYDTTQTIYDRWKDVGYCDDPTIRCWLDTSSVKSVIKNTGLLNQTLDNINFNTFNVSGYLTADSSNEIASQVQSQINSLVVNGDRNTVASKILDIVNSLNQLVNLGSDNMHRARGLYLFGNLYKKVAEGLVSSGAQNVGGVGSSGTGGLAPTSQEVSRWSEFYNSNADGTNKYILVYDPSTGMQDDFNINNLDMKTGVVTLPDGTKKQATIRIISGGNKLVLSNYVEVSNTNTQSSTSSNFNPYSAQVLSLSGVSDDMLNKGVSIHVYYSVLKGLSGKKDFVMVYNSNSGWLVGDETVYNAVKSKGYVEGINYMVNTLTTGDSVVISGQTVYRNYGASDGAIADQIFKILQSSTYYNPEDTTPTTTLASTSNLINWADFGYYEGDKKFASGYENGEPKTYEVLSFDYNSQTIVLADNSVRRVSKDSNNKIIFQEYLD
jgi:tetratricopeptide (TPR) repeat protein